MSIYVYSLDTIGGGCDHVYVLYMQYGHPGQPHRTVDISNTNHFQNIIAQNKYFKDFVKRPNSLKSWLLS